MPSHDAVAYGAVARAFHWITAILVLSMIPAGLVMLRIPAGALQNQLFDFHRSVGVVLFVITALRLIWRWTHTPPPLPDEVPPFQRAAAHLVHYALYAALLVQPIVGWIGTSAFGAPIRVFGLFQMPSIVARNKAMADFFLPLHQYIGWSITAAVTLHIAAALYHHFLRRDGVLMRMVRGT